MAISGPPRLLVLLTLASAMLATACHKKEEHAEPKEDAEEMEGDAGAHAKAAAHDRADAGASGAHAAEPPRKFAVPFAWEASQADALARTRGFLGAMSAENARYMRSHGEAFFTALAAGEKPRATILTCADSRVHTTAFSAAPENDDYLIRNIGNQLGNAEGSVEYGVRTLHTPVLLVMGHTGCDAVKAAMGNLSRESEPVRRELAGLRVGKSTPDHDHAPRDPGTASTDASQAWADAVRANVHHQVKASIAKFPTDIEEGHLTVVGVVYDLRNDLKQGHGKVVVVNVNGQTDPDRIAAFERAISSAPPPSFAAAPAHDDPHAGPASAADPSRMSLRQLLQNAPLKTSARKPERAEKSEHDRSAPVPAVPKTH